MGLLGHVITLKAGMNYESLVVERICKPLKMNSTRITLTPELKSCFTTGHNEFGYSVPILDIGVLVGAGALRSTANDLLKYVSANLGLTPSGLTQLMEKTHAVHFQSAIQNMNIALAWMVDFDAQGREIISHDGATDGFSAFVGFDKTRRRGAVVLSSSMDWPDPRAIGKFLLESEWRSDLRPKETKISSQLYDSYVGQYNADGASSQSGIGIRLEGNRLFAQATGPKSWPVNVLLPPIADELLPESETRFFERLSGRPMTFSRNVWGKVTCLKMDYQGKVFSYKKISNEPPKIPESPKPRVAIKLDTKLLDIVVGHYEFAPDTAHPTGIKLTIWREGEQLVGQSWGKDVLQGAFDIYPESETNFFIKTDGVQLTFIKNDKGEVTAIIDHGAGFPDLKGKKLKNLSE
jgi:hypothetical protein